ncbi:tumor necrosis factor receptor superfamily member 1B [Chanos chanos]|uniref:Tumor necrosis factor receptor superfamily member 1B n=1 Tax=Chanos chanos TaxID=29144 RepID=A0A6J2VKM0_CHACN|nr:tumor necrosis factor receptor superfamily member 1B-like [Chanos chanos]
MMLTIWSFVFAAVVWLVACKLDTVPYFSDGSCRNNGTEYYVEAVQRCCSKCKPGTHLQTECTSKTDSVCEPCGQETYMEGMNYYRNCFKCKRCFGHKGLEYAKNCSGDTNAQCVCKNGHFCVIGYNKPTCEECRKYRSCPPGHGVSQPGTPNSNVKCEVCPEGTFSNQSSNLLTCKPHTDCKSLGRTVKFAGSSTSDAICGPSLLHSTAESALWSSIQSTAQNVSGTISTTTLFPLESTGEPPSTTDSLRSRATSQFYPIGLFSGLFVGLLMFSLIVVVTLYICCRKKDTTKTPIKEVNKFSSTANQHLHNSKLGSSPELHPLVGKSHKDTSVSSTESQAESEQHNGAWPCCTSTQDGVIKKQPEHSSYVNLNITATINCKVKSATGICSVPISPSTCSTQPEPQLPLSQEEVSVPCQEDGGKDARQAVQESGKRVC